MKRKLIDRTETYTAEIEGQCKCGVKINKVLGSSCTMWKNGDRYYEPGDKRAVCIFRCDGCGNPIDETFEALAMEDMGSCDVLSQQNDSDAADCDPLHHGRMAETGYINCPKCETQLITV